MDSMLHLRGQRPADAGNRWYFDAVSASTNASVAVIFYNGGPDGFRNIYDGGPLSVQVSATFSNGTQYGVVVPATGGAVVETGPDGIHLEFKDSGFSFVGSGLDSSEVTYVMTIDSPDIGLQGTITWTSVSRVKDQLHPGPSLFSESAIHHTRPRCGY